MPFSGREREASGLFFEHILDEKSPSDIIDFQLRIIKKNKPLFADVEFDAGSLNRLIAEIESRLSAKEETPLEDVLDYAKELESDAL